MNQRVYDPASFPVLDGIGEAVWRDYTASAVHFRFNGAPTVMGSYYTIGRTCHAQIRVDPGTAITSYAASSFVTLPISSYGYSGMAQAYTIAGDVNEWESGVVVSTAVVRIGDTPNLTVPLFIYAIYQI